RIVPPFPRSLRDPIAPKPERQSWQPAVHGQKVAEPGETVSRSASWLVFCRWSSNTEFVAAPYVATASMQRERRRLLSAHRELHCWIVRGTLELLQHHGWRSGA